MGNSAVAFWSTTWQTQVRYLLLKETFRDFSTDMVVTVPLKLCGVSSHSFTQKLHTYEL